MKLGREIQFFLEFIFDFLKIPIHTGSKNRRLKIISFPPEFEMKFHIYFAPSVVVKELWLLLFDFFKRTKLIGQEVHPMWTTYQSALSS